VGDDTGSKKMDRNQPIESWGVFKPVGHTLITFRDASNMHQAAIHLLSSGFSPKDLLRYTPSEMVSQVDKELEQASVLAEFGQELNLIKAHRTLAVAGYSFLLVHAPDDKSKNTVDALVHQMKVPTAQRYGRFIIEELAVREPSEVVADEARQASVTPQTGESR
jgi:hypothetical protein